MTGEKNRYTTQGRLWKLDDEQLTTPKHDEMVLWLLNKENVIKEIPEVRLFFETQKQNGDIIIQSEHPIFGRNQFLIGYWDIKIIFDMVFDKTLDELKQKYLRGLDDVFAGENKYAKTCYDLTKLPFLASYHKLYNEIINQISKDAFPIYIEVKPRITSFGSTLRQLKTYQSYVPESINRTYLFTMDTGFKTAFESQGIKVIEYRPSS